MLLALYNAFDRRRRPLRNHHFMVFPKAQLVYARVPGAPTTAVRPVLEILSGQSVKAGATPVPDTDELPLWEGDVELLTARELSKRYPDFPVFTVVQTPFARIAACYEDLILSDAPLPAFFVENHFWKSMPLDQFLERAVETSDLQADNFLRSQASILSYKGALVPTLVLDLDRLSADWSKLRSLAQRQSGLDIGNGPAAVAVSYEKTLEAVENAPLSRLLLKRYRKDYRFFFDPSNHSKAIQHDLTASGSSSQ